MDTLTRPTAASRISDLYWRGVWNAKQLAPWIDAEALLVGDARPLWIDWSENQGYVDASILAANGVMGIVGRAGRTWMSVYRDPLFDLVYTQAPHYGLYRTSYHVIHTDKLVVPQTDLWYSVHPERDIIPRWIDLEVDRGDSTAQKADRTWQMAELVESRDGIPPTIYSRYLLVNQWLVPHWTTEQLNHVTWALAQYLFDRTSEHPGPPTLPNGVRADRVLYHQTADKIPGWPGSIESSALDRDRWCLGDVHQMHSYILNNWGGGADPPPDEDLQPFPTEKAMPLRPVLLKDKVALQSDVALTGSNNTGVVLTIPNLPANVKALNLWLIVKADKPGAFVFFGPGAVGEQRFHFGARAQAVNLEADEHGVVLLDGAKLWRQHDAKGGTVRYWLFLTGYFVDAPDVDLTAMRTDIDAIYDWMDGVDAKNLSQDGVIGTLAGKVAAIDIKLAKVKEIL